MNNKRLIRKILAGIVKILRKWPSLYQEIYTQLLSSNPDMLGSHSIINETIYNMVATGSPWLRDLIMQHEAYAASFVRYMAITGHATDECLRQDVLPMSIGYYFPVPNIRDLDSRNIWKRKSDLQGIHFDLEEQVQFLRDLGEKYGEECNWPPNATSDPYQFFTENNSFSFGCAAMLHCMIRELKPKRIFEIGSGNSSLIISKAISINSQETSNPACEYLMIDPYPGEIITNGLPNLSRLIKERVELTNPKLFEELGENDLLFIDSGHTVRTGGDVNFLYLDVLPRLAKGVIVHIHDIPLPYEYPRVYFSNPQFRVFWTEAYLLQGFLSLNSSYSTLISMSYIMKDKPEEFRKIFIHNNPDVHKLTSSSFWMKRIH